MDDKIIEKVRIEKQLVPRLRILGFILLAFSLFAFAWSFFPEGAEEELLVEEELLSEFAETPPMNPYVVAIALASVGITCVAIAWKKKNAELQAETADR